MYKWIWAAALTGFLSASAFGQQTSFTYQGQLKDDGIPADGSYNLVFKLFSASSGGSQIGSTITRNGVVLTNGLFNQTLDFGAGAFTGQPRWLEITVSGVVLGRQPLTATPYALYALSGPGGSGPWQSSGADIFNTNTGNVGIGTNDTTHRLTVAAPDQETMRLLQTTTGFGEGARLNFGDGDYAFIEEDVDDALLIQASRIALSGGEVRLPGGANPSNYNTHFNYSGDGRNYIRGTTIMADSGGNVGIGTSGPLTKLHINNPTESVSHRIETGAGTNAWTKIEFANGNGRWDIGTSRTFNNDVFYMDRPGGLLEFQLSTWGGLGLGTEPQAKLHLFDPVNSVSHRIQTGAGTNGWTRVEFANGDGQWNVGTSRNFNGNQFYFHREGSPNIALGIQPNGDAHLEGNATQAREKGGFVKAMAKVNADGSIAQQYSATGGNITAAYLINGPAYDVTFPFQVNDRFISITPFFNFSVKTVAASFFFDCGAGCGPNTVRVLISDLDDGSNYVANEFFIFVY